MQTPNNRPYTLQVLGPDGFDYQRPITADAAMRVVRCILESGATLEWAGARRPEADGTSIPAEATTEQSARDEAEQTADDAASKRVDLRAGRAERVRLRREAVSRLKESGMTTSQIAEELGLGYSTVFNDLKQIASRNDN